MLFFKAAPRALGLCVAMAALATASFASAETDDLGEIIVSGGLTPVDAQSYARAATVITGDELEQRQVKTVADALRQVPGVHVSRTGAAGGTTAVRIRGSEANHVLVLIDGVETANSSADFEFANLDASHIERIEVLRGPQSALYGAGATAGVINIITKRGVRNGVTAEIIAEGGTAPSKAGSALVRAGNDEADIAIGLAWRDDEGWDTSGANGEKDGARKLTGSLKVTWDATPDLRLRGNARYVNRETEYDPTNFGCGGPGCYVSDGIGRITGEDLTLSAAADITGYGGALVQTPSVSYAFQQNNTTDVFGPSNNEYSTFKVGHQAAFSFGSEEQHTIVGGAQYKLERFQSSFAGSDLKERDQYGIVADYRGDWTDALFVQAGIRHDWNETFEDAFAWSASASYTLFQTGTRFHASIGQAQTNPTFFEQFGFIAGQFVGNPGLTPEKNFGFDAGVEQTFFDGRAKVDVTYFNETLTDEISGSGTTVTNLNGNSKRQGVEVSGSFEPVDGLTIGVSYTYLDADEPSGAQEVRRPKHAAGANIAYRFFDDRATIGADVTYNGTTQQRSFGGPGFSGPRVAVDDYLKVDLNASFAVTDNVEIFGSVENVFDAKYQEVIGYEGQPLTGYAGVKVRF